MPRRATTAASLTWSQAWRRSCIGHAVCAIGIAWSGYHHRPSPAPLAASAPLAQPLEAVVVREEAVQQAMQQIRQRQQAQQAHESQQLSKLKQQARRLKQANLAEQRKLSQLQAASKKKAKKLQQAIASEQHKLAAVQDQHKQAQHKLKAVQKRAQAALAHANQQAEQHRRQTLQAEQTGWSRQRTRQLTAQHSHKVREKVAALWLEQAQWLGLEATLEVHVSQAGQVLSVRVVRSSGDQAFDRAARIAVHKASPLPMPSDPALARSFLAFQFTFRPSHTRNTLT